MTSADDRAPGSGPRAPEPDEPSALVRTAGEAPPGRWTRTASIEHIEDELSDLWREVSQAGGPKSRSLMSNLIVYGEGDGAGVTSAELAEVSRLHPSRVILVRHDGAAKADAEISVHTHGYGVAQFGVEHVSMSVPDRDAVPSLMRRLTVGDLPTSICWAGSTLPDAKTLQRLAPLGRQFLFDSSAWPDPLEAIRAMAPIGSRAGAAIDVADLSWRRLKPLRHAIVQGVDPAVLRRPPGEVRAVTVEAGDTRQAMAWLLGAWIASRLDWRARQRTATASGVTATFDAPAGRATLRIAAAPSAVLRASIETDALAGKAAIDASLIADEIVVRYGWEDVPPLTMMAAARSNAEMLAEELRNLYVDPYLRDALDMVTRVHAL